MFSRVDFDAIGGYDENMDSLGYEDYEMWIRMMKHGCTVTVAPGAIYYYRVHWGDSETGKRSHAERMAYIRTKHPEVR